MPALNAFKGVRSLPRKYPDYNYPRPHRKAPVTAYGDIISLPSTVVKGQVSVAVKGLTATNLIRNGDFEDGTAEWGANQSSNTVVNNTLINEGSGAGSIPYVRQSINRWKRAHIMYLRYRCRVTNPNCTNVYATTNLPMNSIDGVVSPVENQWYIVSGILTISESEHEIRIRHSYDDAEMANGKAMEIQEVLAIDLTATFGAGNEPTKEECDKIFTHYFDGTKSTVSASRLKSVGKNLIPNVLLTQGYDLGSGHTDSDKHKYIKLEKVLAGTYQVQIANPNFADLRIRVSCPKNNSVTPTFHDNKYIFTISSDTTLFINVRYADSRSWLEEVSTGQIWLQLARSNQVTSYEPYTESTQYIQAKDSQGKIIELRSLPNGTKDEIRVSDGKLVKRVSELTLNGGMVNTLGITSTGTAQYIDFINIVNDNDSWSDAKYNVSIYNWTKLKTVPSSEQTTRTFRAVANTLLLYFPIGTFATKEDAINWINANPITLAYQLAEPIETYYPKQELICYPSGTIYIEPVVAMQIDEYTDTGIEVDIPIKEFDYIYKINTTTGEYISVDFEDITIASDGLSFTIAGAVLGDFFEYGYWYSEELTTIPEVEYSTPAGLTLPIPIGESVDLWAPDNVLEHVKLEEY